MQRKSTGVTGVAALLAGAISFWLGPVAAQDKKASWLADGGDPARTSWQQQRDAPQQDQREGDDAALDAADRQPAAAAAQPVRAVDRARRRDSRRSSRDCGRRRRVRQPVRRRRREGHADLEAEVRQHVRGAGRRPRRRTAVPGRSHGDAAHRADGRARQVQDLRDLVGRAAAAARRRDRTGSRARRAVPSAERQAVRA